MPVLPVLGGGYIEIKPSKIIAVGLNYFDHVKECGNILDKESFSKPKEPILFAKTPNVLVGPGDTVYIPAIAGEYGFDLPRTDLEAELAVIISKRAKHVSAENAFSYIYGFTCFNDVSQRNIQKSDPSGWFRGKSFDGFGPIGPLVVLTGDMPDPQNLAVKSRVNGVLKQNASTKDMIFTVAELVSFISHNMTLEEGDIIATGTPSGVCTVQPGDIMEVEIENIGILRNPVEQEKI